MLEAGTGREIFVYGKTGYGLLSSCGYDGADRLRARGRRGGDVPVEETMRRVIEAYGTEGQVFAIPNCVAVSS